MSTYLHVKMETVDLHIFDITCIPADDDVSACSALVAQSRAKDQICQYFVREDRCRCLGGALLLNHAVGLENIKRTDVSMRPIKPCHHSRLFNLSHDEDMVVLATTHSQSVGVDVMKIKLSNSSWSCEDMLANLRSIFSDPEWRYIHSGSEQSRLERFYQLWTAKEAYVKCIGTGLYVEPQYLELSGFPSAGSAAEDFRLSVNHKGHIEASNEFTIRVFSSIVTGYIIAVCVGPVNLCDPSWTQFVDPRLSCPSGDTADVLIGLVTHHSLEDLVHS